MRSNPAVRTPVYPNGIHPALRNFADEAQGVIVRLMAYLGGFAILAVVAVNLYDEAPIAEVLEPVVRSGWSAAARPYPAFAVSQFDLPGKTETYDVLRHPEGGRKDIMRWAAGQNDKLIAEIELYRPGRELNRIDPPATEIATRMGAEGAREIVGEGIVDSKFGPVALFGFADRADDTKRCLGFLKTLADVNLRISGWSCQGETLPARRLAIACMMSRLVLLTAGNDPKLAELFAHAELKRSACSIAPAPFTASADWVTGAQNPRLRGSL